MVRRGLGGLILLGVVTAAAAADGNEVAERLRQATTSERGVDGCRIIGS